MSRSKVGQLELALQGFAAKANIASKGKLATVLFVTWKAREGGLPLELATLRTSRKGQVAGLGRESVQRILSGHGIIKILAEEGGRTSRGSLGLAEDYASFLNLLLKRGSICTQDLVTAENWWIEQVKLYFNRQCFRVEIDPSLSMSKVVRSILEEARRRQQETPGATIEGTVLQHLVGAKLALIGTENLVTHGSNVADGPTDRAGDFKVGDTVFHVTTAPTDRLMAKCMDNLGAGLRPVVICPRERAQVALQLAEMAGIKDRIDLFEAEAFISLNVNEVAKFLGGEMGGTVKALLAHYNRMVDENESDPSLRIETK